MLLFLNPQFWTRNWAEEKKETKKGKQELPQKSVNENLLPMRQFGGKTSKMATIIGNSNYDQLECMINIIKCSIFSLISDLAKVANLCPQKKFKHWNKSHTFSNFLQIFFHYIGKIHHNKINSIYNLYFEPPLILRNTLKYPWDMEPHTMLCWACYGTSYALCMQIHQLQTHYKPISSFRVSFWTLFFKKIKKRGGIMVVC